MGFNRYILTFILCLLTGFSTGSPPQEANRIPITVYYGSDFDFMPYEFLNDEGQPAGFDIELMRAIGKEMNMEVIFRYDKWYRLRNRLETKQGIDIIVMSESELSKEKIDISLPVSVLNYVVYTRKRSPSINSLEELRGKKIIVLKGDFVDDFLITNGFGKELVYVDAWSDVLTLLDQGYYDCGVIALSYGVRFIDEHHLSNIVSSGAPIYYEEFGFSVAKGREDLLNRINEGLIRVKESGKYDALYNKWLLHPEEKNKALRYILRNWPWLIFAAFSFFGLWGFWSWSLRKLVRRKTFELEKELMARKLTEEHLFKNTRELYSVIYKQSHNLRGPLTSILGVVNLAKYDVHSGTAKKYFKMIQEQAGYLEEALRDFSEMTKLKENEKISRINFDEIVDESMARITCIKEVPKVKIIRAIQPIHHFYAIEPLVLMIFEKLIENGIEYWDKNASDPYVKIEVKQIGEGDRVWIQIEDNGVGIDSDLQKKVFQMFYRGTERSHGSGLGLYLVKNAVNKLEGTIELKSKQGKGTRVTIELPNLY